MQAPANLPMVPRFVGRILDRLEADFLLSILRRQGVTDDIRRARKRVERTSFEAFLEQVDIGAPGSAATVLRSYAGGSPNGNHRAVAALVRAGTVRAVVTTNFDTLVEAACGDLGLPLRVERPGLPPRGPGGSTLLLKVHGSAGDLDRHPETLRATLRRVGRGLGPRNSRRLRELLDAPALFAGYRGADLDLRATLLAASRADHFWLVHGSPDPEHAILTQSPARAVPGDLNSATNNPLASLARELTGDNIDVLPPASPDWSAVDHWLDGLQIVQAALVLGQVFTYVKEGLLARACLEEALAQGAPDRERLEYLIATSLADDGHYTEALRRFRALGSRDLVLRAWTLDGIAFCLKQQGARDEAEATYQESLRLREAAAVDAERRSYRLYTLRDLASLALARADEASGVVRRQLARQALDYLKDVVPGVRGTGDLRNLANVLRLRARARQHLGRSGAARADLRTSLELLDVVGDDRGWSMAARALANVEASTGAVDEARQLLEKAERIALNARDHEELPKIRAMLQLLATRETTE